MGSGLAVWGDGLGLSQTNVIGQGGRGGLRSGRDARVAQQPMFSNPLLEGTLRRAVCRRTAWIPLRPNKFRYTVP